MKERERIDRWKRRGKDRRWEGKGRLKDITTFLAWHHTYITSQLTEVSGAVKLDTNDWQVSWNPQ